MQNVQFSTVNHTPTTTTTPSNINSTPKRTRESPESDNQEKKSKSTGMELDGPDSQQMLASIFEKLHKLDKLDNLERDISTIKNTIVSIENSQKILNERLNSLSQEVIVITSKQKSTDANVHDLTIEMKDIKHKVTQIDIIRNQLDQDILKCDVSAFGIPSKYADKHDDLITALNQSLDINLSSSSFKFLRFMNKKKQDTCNLFMRFNDFATKSTFMTAVNGLSKGPDGKRNPITVEDIFEEYKDPNKLTGLEIHFSNSLTLHNRQIIKLKGTVRQAINFMWEQDGRILMKHNNNSKIEQALSVNHVLDYASKSPNQQTTSIRQEINNARHV